MYFFNLIYELNSVMGSRKNKGFQEHERQNTKNFGF